MADEFNKLNDAQLTEEMKKTKDKCSQIEKELYALEKQIYNLETNYLQDTYYIGNLVKGWSGYLSNRFVLHLTLVCYLIFNAY